MNENTTMVLRGALTHLRVQRQEIETAIAAILAVLGEGDLVERPAAPAPQPACARRAAPARRSGKPTASTQSAETSAPTGRVAAGEWRERALTALRADVTPASVNTLLTRLRVLDRERQAAYGRLWDALKALIADGAVVKIGREYALARQGAAA